MIKGQTKHSARIMAVVKRADGTVEDYGVIAGPALQVWWSKFKRSVKRWLQLLECQKQVEQ